VSAHATANIVTDSLKSKSKSSDNSQQRISIKLLAAVVANADFFSVSSFLVVGDN
jgi:hypothetical protein